jgi:hypothetical protein
MGRHSKNSNALVARCVRQKLARIDPSNSNAQRQSPLFSKIPPEIRNQIFKLSLSQDLSSITSTFLGTRAPGIHTALLSTCRLIYYETNSIPMRSAAIFCGDGFGERAITWFSQLTRKNVAEMNHVYGYMGYGYLLLERVVNLPQFRPKHVTFSIPQPSWKPLLLDQQRNYMTSFFPPDVGHRMLPDSLETVTYEFKAQPQFVKDLVKKIKSFAFDEQSLTREDGRGLSILNGDMVSCSPWELPSWDPPNSHADVLAVSVKIVFRLAPL